MTAFNAPNLLICGAQVIDGTGAERISADVLVAGSVIAAILAPGTGSADAVIDGRGKVLCPGFIDTHSHDDALVLQPSIPHPKLTQGVTTVVTGNCGVSLAPLVANEPPAPLDLLGCQGYRYASFGDYLREVDLARPAVNVVPLVGHNTLRVQYMRDWRKPASAEEQLRLRRAVAAAMEEGAFGLSTGVYYPPSRAATTEELVALCEPVGECDGIVAMHIRDEGDGVDEALREALHVGKTTGARLVLSHHKVVGPRNFGRTRQTLLKVEEAAATQEVCVDCYPYEASSTTLFPEKAMAIGNVLVSWSRPMPECAGRSLLSLASEWGVDLGEAARRLMPAGGIYFGMSQEDVDRVVSHPLSMVGSDGLPHDGRPHPRLWGTFPRVLSHYVRERRLLKLEQAVHKMTGLPAQRFGLRSRGLIAPGYSADLVLFDEDKVKDNATYDNPTAACSGIGAVIVNGRLALDHGRHVDVHAGERLLPARMVR